MRTPDEKPQEYSSSTVARISFGPSYICSHYIFLLCSWGSPLRVPLLGIPGLGGGLGLSESNTHGMKPRDACDEDHHFGVELPVSRVHLSGFEISQSNQQALAHRHSHKLFLPEPKHG